MRQQRDLIPVIQPWGTGSEPTCYADRVLEFVRLKLPEFAWIYLNAIGFFMCFNFWVGPVASHDFVYINSIKPLACLATLCVVQLSGHGFSSASRAIRINMKQIETTQTKQNKSNESTNENHPHHARIAANQKLRDWQEANVRKPTNSYVEVSAFPFGSRKACLEKCSAILIEHIDTYKTISIEWN